MNPFFSLIGVDERRTRHAEKLLSALGAAVGIGVMTWLSGVVVGGQGGVLVVGSMGASAVLLFAVPHGALSQPWALVGGHLLSAAVGVSCAAWIPDPLSAAALAVGGAVGVMYYARCIHPPGGATALVAVVGGAEVQALGYGYLLAPVLLNVGVLLVVAILFNAPFPWRRYPAHLARAGRVEPAGPTPSHATLMEALTALDSFVDITEADLARICRIATDRAAREHLSPEAIVLGRFYGNGEAGDGWEVRRVIDMPDAPRPGMDLVIYKEIVGPARNTTGSCSRESFARWAREELVRVEERWLPAP